jgi:microcystin-dependent protein
MATLPNGTMANPQTSYFAAAGAGGGGVSQIVAGTSISVSPAGGTGVVTISSPITTGMILMFNGVSAPAGWNYCDGTNGTPDLRDRFVICSSGTYPSGSSGGTSNVSLVVNNLPDHQHGGAAVLGSGGTAGINDYNVTGIGGNTTGISSVGYVTPGGTPFAIIPPYYALAYIMKL